MPKMQKRGAAMAYINSISENKTRAIHSKAHSDMDYKMDRRYFAMWTYKEGDKGPDRNPTQTILIEKDIAIALRDALDRFINTIDAETEIRRRYNNILNHFLELNQPPAD
jgi:hypothetical protein